MTAQPPLITPTGDRIPSPVFRPRPGWGGRLSAWFRENGALTLFRLALVVGVTLVAVSLLRPEGLPPAATASPSPTTVVRGDGTTVTVEAQRGEGMTHLAARALDSRLGTHHPPRTLAAVEHLFAVHTLARQAGWRVVLTGEAVGFRTADLDTAADHGRALSPSQRARWSRFLRKHR